MKAMDWHPKNQQTFALLGLLTASDIDITLFSPPFSMSTALI